MLLRPDYHPTLPRTPPPTDARDAGMPPKLQMRNTTRALLCQNTRHMHERTEPGTTQDNIGTTLLVEGFTPYTAIAHPPRLRTWPWASSDPAQTHVQREPVGVKAHQTGGLRGAPGKVAGRQPTDPHRPRMTLHMVAHQVQGHAPPRHGEQEGTSWVRSCLSLLTQPFLLKLPHGCPRGNTKRPIAAHSPGAVPLTHYHSLTYDSLLNQRPPLRHQTPVHYS